MPESLNEPRVLSSWKEIAQYLGKGVRTVQRWERELELPIRRPSGDEKHVIIAIRAELEGWVRTSMVSRPRTANGNGNYGNGNHRQAEADRILAEAREQLRLARELRNDLERTCRVTEKLLVALRRRKHR